MQHKPLTNDNLLSINLKLDRILKELADIKGGGQKATRDPSFLLSVQEAATYLQLSRSRIYTLVYNGKIQPLQHRKRGRMLFSMECLQKYLFDHSRK